MTKQIFFDTDCISSFMRVGEVNLVEALFGSNIVFPKQVYDELSNPKVLHLKAEADRMIRCGSAKVMDIDFESNAFYIYRKLTSPYNMPIIGKGESAAIALAYTHNGILASNNLRDVARYVKEYNLVHFTTLDIMVAAEEQGLASALELESIWRQLKAQGFYLPEGTYEENKAQR